VATRIIDDIDACQMDPELGRFELQDFHDSSTQFATERALPLRLVDSNQTTNARFRFAASAMQPQMYRTYFAAFAQGWMTIQ